MTTTPVFVIHGTSNRTGDELTARVRRLQKEIGDRWTLYPAFWGDLGAAPEERWIHETIPGYRPGREEVRGPEDDPLPAPGMDLLAAALAAAEASDGPAPDEARQVAMVVSGIERALGEHGVSDELLKRQIIEAVGAAWTADMYWLWQVTDAAVLDEIGHSVATDLLSRLPEEPIEVRDAAAVRELVGNRLADLNRVIGVTLGAAGGRVNALVRIALAGQIAGNFGDVIVYQRKQQEIHDRIRQIVADVDDRLGRDPEHPVHLIGHSLGATIALDLATRADDPLWTDSVITFGSLWPLFHVCDPRRGLPPYTGSPVRLPPSVRRWTNLWEPLDPLAFVAARVFTLANGEPPRDVEVQHRYASGLSTHSVYWTAPQLVSELVRALSG
ncbi:esterase/lipase family protein [Amycolatopsis sp. NPDC098790]|uniref:esterase/lipase family protein n=1 Tax=Amycolatopsis sp. NPDC098790 TaxID=3363939 RepID=UPI0038020F47